MTAKVTAPSCFQDNSSETPPPPQTCSECFNPPPKILSIYIYGYLFWIPNLLKTEGSIIDGMMKLVAGPQFWGGQNCRGGGNVGAITGGGWT